MGVAAEQQERQRLLVSVPETLYQLSISRSRLYELIDSNDLVQVKIGRRTLITQQSISDFVDRLAGVS